MADQLPTHEFGKRRQVASLPPEPGPKRSGHVALLVMGTLAVGGGAYGLMPRESCTPPPSGMVAPALSQSNDACPQRGSSASGGSWSSFHFYGGRDSSDRASSTSAAEPSRVARGGFGSLARAFGFSGGG